MSEADVARRAAHVGVFVADPALPQAVIEVVERFRVMQLAGLCDGCGRREAATTLQHAAQLTDHVAGCAAYDHLKAVTAQYGMDVNEIPREVLHMRPRN